MDWQPHIVVKADNSSVVKTATTALRTLNVGFPGKKAIVHFIGTNLDVTKEIKSQCGKGGHKFVQYPPSIRQSQLHHTICSNSRLPVVLIRGTVVFYEDMTDYSTTKLFGADFQPKRYMYKGNDKVITLGGVEKSVIFVPEPVKLVGKVEEITAVWRSPAQRSLPIEKRRWWDSQWMIMDGVCYQQQSGIFNLIYHWDKKLVADFNKKTAAKYESVFAGNDYPDMFKAMDENGEDTSLIRKYINAALNDDWKTIKGSKKKYLDSIKDTVI
jgi:hypothetical protein|tara:strand:- start:110 stop:919 length:810 start_codon:yes stop_codon:yes gene_type:complete